MKRIGRLVCVHWHDHWSRDDAGWKAEKSFEEGRPVDCLSVGWIVKESRTTLTLCSSWNQDGDLDGDVTVVKKAIHKVYDLDDPSLDVRKR